MNFQETEQIVGNAVKQGFRLAQLEVFNWGTFDGKIWKLQAKQDNCLLTGNIGSGKSTLVDGLTTLLVPPRKLAFNKAAGAVEKERSLESYFHGFYTSEQGESGKAKAVGLRQNKHYSVLLAHFHAQALAETITIAQIFWLKPGEQKVKRLYIVAQSELTIKDDFSGFGAQIQQLRKKLRADQTVQLFDAYAPYAQAFSKFMGLGTDGKALALFNQTISMKSVGSVTDFVRQNMLEKSNTEAQLAELESNYEVLKRLHDSVVAARHKVELLSPVVKLGDEAIKTEEERTLYAACREAVEPFIAKKSVVLYEARLQKRHFQLEKLNIYLQELEDKKGSEERKIAQIKEDLNNNGGLRLQQLEQDISRLSTERDRRQRLYRNYQQTVLQLGLDDKLNADLFLQNIQKAKDIVEQQVENIIVIDDKIFAAREKIKELQTQQNEVITELKALMSRKSNIPLNQLQLRQRLCEQLSLDESELPFVGELIQVKAKQQYWQGAIERVMHNFALSLVVSDSLYQQVSEAVNNTHLGGRLVYYRVKEVKYRFTSDLSADMLPSKVEIKPDSEHYDWLHNELHHRFNYQCCEQLADFRRSEKAITVNGQMKSGISRHEKDDRYNINDKRRYVLGWSNQEKKDLLTAQLGNLQQQVSDQTAVFDHHEAEKRQLYKIKMGAENLANFNFPFNELNWPSSSDEITLLQQEKIQIESSSNQLKQIQQRLQSTLDGAKQLEEKCNSCNKEIGGKEVEIESDKAASADNLKIWQSLAQSLQDKTFAVIEQIIEQYFSQASFNLKGIATRKQEIAKKLNDKVQHLQEKIGKKERAMVAAMSDFAHDFPNDVTELDKSLASLPEYRVMLDKLVQEDLPRHEAKFKEMLNRDTIRAMALFRSQLERLVDDINARIVMINKALKGLDYQLGTYIEIDMINSQDVDVRDFKQRLKQCVEYASDDNIYSEDKFIRVKDLIEQMRNQPKWTEKVVDVRYWHLFNVVERYREDNSVKECYSDSGGKSGGQKEKLAYSILAAAILLQYGLMDEGFHISQQAKRRFNLVVIDEAFARGSKDSTRFGLELFKQLGLQLLLVTPLQKLDVIEHYVQQVHFVDQKNNRSMLLNMTISEYQEKLNKHKKRQQLMSMIHE